MKRSANRTRVFTSVLARSVDNSLKKTVHLVSLIDSSQLSYQPSVPAERAPLVSMGCLLGHLLDCMAGFCAAFYAAFPAKLDSLRKLRDEPVNHFCQPREALERMRVFRREIARGFRICSDKQLKRKLKTVFQDDGVPLATILIANLEHLLNHKHQLFFYLRLLGAPVGTKDLYYLPEAKGRIRKRPS